MDNEIVSLPVNENDEGAIAQTQGKPTDHKTDNNNKSMDEDNYMSQNPTKLETTKKTPRPARRRKSGEARERPSHMRPVGLRENPL